MALRAIYKTGSQCVLPQPNDFDYVKIYDTKEEARQALINNRDHSVCWHFESLDRLPHIFVGCYIYTFMELVWGDEIKEIKDFKLSKHKKEYTELFKKYRERLPRESKIWYHFVIAYFLLKNRKLKLTNEQIEIAQHTHDNGINCEMYQLLIEYFV